MHKDAYDDYSNELLRTPKDIDVLLSKTISPLYSLRCESLSLSHTHTFLLSFFSSAPLSRSHSFSRRYRRNIEERNLLHVVQELLIVSPDAQRYATFSIRLHISFYLLSYSTISLLLVPFRDVCKWTKSISSNQANRVSEHCKPSSFDIFNSSCSRALITDARIKYPGTFF